MHTNISGSHQYSEHVLTEGFLETTCCQHVSLKRPGLARCVVNCCHTSRSGSIWEVYLGRYRDQPVRFAGFPDVCVAGNIWEVGLEVIYWCGPYSESHVIRQLHAGDAMHHALSRNVLVPLNRSEPVGQCSTPCSWL